MTPDYRVFTDYKGRSLYLVDSNQIHVGNAEAISLSNGMEFKMVIPVMYLSPAISMQDRLNARILAEHMNEAFKRGVGFGRSGMKEPCECAKIIRRDSDV